MHLHLLGTKLTQVDGVEFNVGNGMHQCAVALSGKGRATGYLLGMHQFRKGRASRLAVVRDVQTAVQSLWCSLVPLQGQGCHSLLQRIGQAKGFQGALSEFHTYNSR